MGTDDLSLEQLIAWHSEIAADALKTHQSAGRADLRRKAWNVYEKLEATVELLIELSVLREEGY